MVGAVGRESNESNMICGIDGSFVFLLGVGFIFYMVMFLLADE